MSNSPRDALVEFFGAVLPSPKEGQVFVAATPYSKKNPDDKPAMKQTYAATHEELADAVLQISSVGKEAYYALGHFMPHETGSGNPGRKGENVRGLKSFWLDIDIGKDKAEAGLGYLTKKDGADALQNFVTCSGLPVPSHLIDSGGGIHAYFAMDRVITPEEWKPVSLKLKALAAKQGFLADPSRTADMASVLRPPCTFNHKLDTPRDVKIKYSMQPIKFETFVDAINSAHTTYCGSLEISKPSGAISALHSNQSLGANLKHPPLHESPEEISRIKAMLATIPADCNYDQWRDVVWAVASLNWHCGEDLAREWSESATNRFNPDKFHSLWSSYVPSRGIGFGTLHHYAKEHDHQPVEAVSFTGNGEDVENGRLFANTWRGKMLFVHETKEVLLFDDAAGWISAPPGETDRAAKQVLNIMHEEASARYKAAPDDPKTKRLMGQVTRTSRAPNLRAMIAMAESENGMTQSLNAFDADAMQLGVVNGVLDLRTGHLLPVSPSLLVTKRCNVTYDQGATCPQWELFLAEVQPDPDIREFIQRWAGYGLTGSVQEQKFVFLHGSGANGKSVFVELIAWLLGDYAKKIATEMLMQHQRSPQAASPDIVSLKGRRFVYANETEEGRKLAEARVKEMTGGDTLTGRLPYGKADITFSPTHKLAIVGNHKPEIGDSSNGMWRRVCLVEFNVTIEENLRDPKLLEKLKAEGAGILNWLLAGLKKWQHGGLSVPRKIEAATAAYRDEQDTIGEWLREDCITGNGLTAKKDDVYRAYHTWALNNGHHPLAQKRLTRRLGERGFPALPDKRSLGGLALNQHGMMAVR